MSRRIGWFICSITLVLSSCIGIQSDIRINDDGSGELTLAYSVSQFIKNIDEGRSEKQLPLPINEADFRRSTEGIEGLRLRRMEQSEDEENVYIQAELEFDSVDAINALGTDGQIGISLEMRGDAHIFRQLIYETREGEEPEEGSLDMIEAFFEGYELVYSVTAPAAIQTHSIGELAPDGRTVVYTATVPEILKNSEPLVLEVVW